MSRGKSLDTICLSSVSSEDENASQIDDEASMQGEVTKSQSATQKRTPWHWDQVLLASCCEYNLQEGEKAEKQVHLMFYWSSEAVACEYATGSVSDQVTWHQINCMHWSVHETVKA